MRYELMKLKILILMVMLFPVLLCAQYDLFDDDYLFDEDRPQTIIDSILNAAAAKVFDDENIDLRYEMYSQRDIFDMAGNHVFSGYGWFEMNYSDYNNNTASILAGRRGRETRYLWSDTKWNRFTSSGIGFPLMDMMHRVYIGLYVPLNFTPLTLKKIKLFGVRYDMIGTPAEDEEANNMGLKSFKLKSFFTPRFFEYSGEYHADNLHIERNNRLLYGVRAQVDIGLAHDMLPSYLKGHYLGYTFTRMQLRNGLHHDVTGNQKDFLDDWFNKYSSYHEYNLKRNNHIIFNTEESLNGVDLTGKIFSFNYYVEYVHDSRKELEISQNLVTNVTVDSQHISYIDTAYSKGEVEKIDSSAYMVNLHSKDVLGSILEEPKLSMKYELWNIEPHYGPGWSMDDDDDNDGMLDEDLFAVDGFFPYETGDKYYNEPQEGVTYRKYNRNKNAIPDYNEDFLLFFVDQYFENTMIFEDDNHNGIMDYDENDLDPDYRYDRNRRGMKGYIGLNPFKIGTFYIGGSMNKIIEADITNNRTDSLSGYGLTVEDSGRDQALSYFFGYGLFTSIAEMINVETELLYEVVQDEIADDYVSKKEDSFYQVFNRIRFLNKGYQDEDEYLIKDSYAYQDNNIFKWQAMFSLIKYKNLTAQVKLKRIYNKRNFDNLNNQFSRNILKIGYEYTVPFLDSLKLFPQLKLLKGINAFYDSEGLQLSFSKDPIIMDQKEYFIMNTFIFIMQYNITQYFYLLGGTQFKNKIDEYNPELTSDRKTYGVQFVMKQASNLGGRPSRISFLMGYKYSGEDFKTLDLMFTEETFFLSISAYF
jgi:hypothetical protein